MQRAGMFRELLIYPDYLIFSPEVLWKFPDSLILHLRPKLLWTNIKLRESPWAAHPAWWRLKRCGRLVNSRHLLKGTNDRSLDTQGR